MIVHTKSKKLNFNRPKDRSSQIPLTPFESPWPLQNLIVTLASCGINLPTPFLRGAFAVIQPCFRKSAFAVILLATSSKQDHSETRPGMCYLVGKEDILKWESACRTQYPKDWRQLLRCKIGRHLTHTVHLTHLQAPTGIQATSKVLENGIKMPGHQTLALVINQVLNGKIIFSRHILVVATACSLHCFVISLLFSDSFKMSLL